MQCNPLLNEHARGLISQPVEWKGMRTSQLALIVAALVVLAAVLAIYLSGNRNPANITMCGTGKAGTGYLLYAYGTEKGIFEKHGLNVSFVSFRDVYTMMLAFFSGKVTTTSMSLGLAGMSLDSGESFRIGMAVGTSSDHVLLVREGIEGIEQLRGKVLGVHGRTSDNYNIMKWYLESKGIDKSFLFPDHNRTCDRQLDSLCEKLKQKWLSPTTKS